MEEQNGNERNEIYSKKVRAGKRTYFFDVKSTRSNDFYLTITESKRKQKDEGYFYEKHKIFLYKEDFHKFRDALTEAVEHITDELLDGYEPPKEDEMDFSSEDDGVSKDSKTKIDSDLNWD